MKKIFTLIAMALMAASVNAANEVDIPLDNWEWSYNATTTYADGIMTITLTGEWGQGSTGYNTIVDWSKYGRMSVVIESYANDYGEVKVLTDQLKEGSTWDYVAVGEKTFGTITSQTTINVDLDPEKAKTVRQIYIKGKAVGDVIKVSRVYLTESVEYEETGTSIAFDEWGNITSDKFAGFSGDDKVVFTVEATGDATGVVGWGIGSIKSLDGSVVVAGALPLTQIGDNEYTYTMSELKAALEAPVDQYNRQGIYWNVYDQGNAKCSRKSVMVYKVKGGTTSINSIKNAAQQEGARYNLAGQKVNDGYKGVVIMNGKKIVVK